MSKHSDKPETVAKHSAEDKWSRIAVRLQRALGFAPPTLEEAEADMAEAEEAPMSGTEISRIVDDVCGK